jgi:hypothetical protein
MSFESSLSSNSQKVLYDVSFQNVNTETINNIPVPPGGTESKGPINNAQLSDGAGGFLDSGVSLVNTTNLTTLTSPIGNGLRISTNGTNGQGVITLNSNDGCTLQSGNGRTIVFSAHGASTVVFPVVNGTSNTQVLTWTGRNNPMSWQEPTVNTYPNFSIPYNAFNYFVAALNTDGLVWASSTSINGAPYDGGSTPNLDFGTLNFDIAPSQLGTYRFCVAYLAGANTGILNCDCDGVTTVIDTYNAVTNIISYQWEQTFTVAETKSVHLYNNGKNGLSSSYYIQFTNDNLQIYRIA